MQFVLQVNERVVAGNIEANVTKNTSHDARTDNLRFRLNDDLLQVLALVLDREPWELVEANVDAEGLGDALDTEQVISVRCYLDLVDVLV